jgi:hypothetical protein
MMGMHLPLSMQTAAGDEGRGAKHRTRQAGYSAWLHEDLRAG